MNDIQRRLAAVSDSRGRIVSIFLGAVLLPSIALSVLSFNAVPKHAENLKISLLRQAEQLLYYTEQDLERAARARALKAARAVGPDLLLEGRASRIHDALQAAGLADMEFDSLRLEAWSSARVGPPGPSRRDDMRALSEALGGFERPLSREEEQEEDAVPLTTPGGEELGVVRFRFAHHYAHEVLVRDYFERQFMNPQHAWVIRVSEPAGGVVYENAPTKSSEDFEVTRFLSAPSFEGVKLELRYRDRSIEQEVRRLALAKTALIGFIDVMLLAGLALVFANVRRELRLSRHEERLRGERQPRAEDAARPHPPLRGDARARPRAERREGPAVPPHHQQGEPPPHPAHQQHPRLLEDRGGAEGVPLRPRRRGRGGAGRRRGVPLPDRAAGLRARGGRARRPARAADRPGGALAGAHQPRQQRDQVQPGREEDRDPRPPRGRARCACR